MAAPRLKMTRAKKTNKTTKQIVPKQVTQLAGKANESVAAAMDFAKANPWLTAAGGVAVLAVGWSARRLWLPLAATAAIQRMIPGNTDTMSLDRMAKAVQHLKSSFMR